MSGLKQVVIVGGGLAGATAARSLREEGFDGHVILLGDEHHPPYERPPLSKEYMRGESEQSAAFVESEHYWGDHEIELHTGVPASRIDLATARLELADSTSLPFDRLVLATGAAPRPLAIPGDDLEGVVKLRHFEDADRIRAMARKVRRILVVGGGWIASEVAASLRMLGHDVTMAMRGRRPLEGALGPHIGEVYRGLHEEHGVTVLPETEIITLDGHGTVRRALTASGAWLDADLVVVAIGATPRVELARTAGLTVADGIVVDAHLQTSEPRVLAAGDAALVPHAGLGRSLRIEHWGAAAAQGAHAARTLLDGGGRYDELPYYFSDQYQTGMEFWGDPALPGDLVVRGDIETRSFTAFWHDADRISAVLSMHIHHHDHPHHAATGHRDTHTDHHHEQASSAAHGNGHVDPVVVERLIRSTVPTKLEALRDPDVPLETLPATRTEVGSARPVLGTR